MGWATHWIAKLQQGETVRFRPRGHSMTGKVDSGQLCTIAPVHSEALEVGDIVLCKVRGQQYLHLVKAIDQGWFLIGNHRGGLNGWIGGQAIYGKLIALED